MTPPIPRDIQSLRLLINDHLFPLDESVADDADLYAEGLDSMALMQLILLLEQEYGVTLEPEDLNREYFSTLAKLSAFLEQKESQS